MIQHGALILTEQAELDRLVRAAVAEAVSAVVESHAEEVRELRRGLFAMKGLLTAAEAGEILGGVTSDTVMEYVREKGLPCYRPGRSPLFYLDDLKEWVMRFPEGPVRQDRPPVSRTSARRPPATAGSGA